jgi:hypothetical protein
VFAVCIFLANSQSPQTIWSRLGATDDDAYQAVGDIFDRASGLAHGDPCINHFFYHQGLIAPPTHRMRFLAFLCVAFGGNSFFNQSTFAGCNYTDLSGKVQYFSENITAALANVYGPLHFQLDISPPHQTYFKAVFSLVVKSFFTNGQLLLDIQAVLDSTDNYTISGNDTTVDCSVPTVDLTVSWMNPVSVTESLPFPGTVCFQWADNGVHTVNMTSSAVTYLTLMGFGAGPNISEAIASGVDCRNNTAGATPCDVLPPFPQTPSPFRYCHTFYYETPGVYTFNDAVNGNELSATLNVGSSSSSHGTNSQASHSSGSVLSSWVSILS